MSFVVQNPGLKTATSPGHKGFFDARNALEGLGIHTGMRVADFGCGSGYFTILMAGLVGKEGKVTALDVQESALETVRGKAKDGNLANIETVRADLEVPGSSKLAEGSQDVVVMANVLFQSQKKEAILAEAHRVLAPTGRLLILEWDKGAGGFGPPDSLRMDRTAMQTFVEKEGFVSERTLETGQYHYGLVFTKA